VIKHLSSKCKVLSSRPQFHKKKKKLDEQIKEIIKCRSNITIKARKGEKVYKNKDNKKGFPALAVCSHRPDDADF
jgi:2C-methyl-D-erythritol 2,4-cyclodiphosphate synthase